MQDASSETVFTTAVKAQQDRLGSRAAYERWEEKRGFQQEIDEELAQFIAERDSLYLGTASADGQPYIQHRGGPKGFLKVLDARTLGLADFSGNRQYISLGNLSENPRAFLFLMDYEKQLRIKIWGRAEFAENEPKLLASLGDPDYDAVSERVIRFHVEAWDKNCRQHIPRLVPGNDSGVAGGVAERIAALEAELAGLRASCAPDSRD